MIESTTEISSLEGTSPRDTASTSAHTVPNILIADYGREREKKIHTLLRLNFNPRFLLTGGLILKVLELNFRPLEEIFLVFETSSRALGPRQPPGVPPAFCSVCNRRLFVQG